MRFLSFPTKISIPVRVASREAVGGVISERLFLAISRLNGQKLRQLEDPSLVMDEREPLLPFSGTQNLGPRSSSSAASLTGDLGDCDHHTQFCRLIGVRPVHHPHGKDHVPHPQSLYARACKRRRYQSCTYLFTATLINTLLLSQVVLGAALTGLGASDSSRILITVFGALNTIIAGLIAFLKSRGQPLRARMFRDDLSRVVDEIENSAVMWYGISSDVHGYDAIDIDEQVTVRSEVARLTRLYDKAVKTNTMNDPDMYSAGKVDSYNAGLRKSLGAAAHPQALPEPEMPTTFAPQPSAPVQVEQPPAAAANPDDSPASQAPAAAAEPPKPDQSTSATDNVETPTAPTSENPAADTGPSPDDKGREANTAPVAPVQPSSAHAMLGDDPDASPACAARLPKKEESSKSGKTLVEDSDSAKST